MFKFLSGYRTYMAAMAIVVAGFAQMGAGDLTGGLLHIVQGDAVITILQGVGLGALRAGVEKVLQTLRTGSPLNMGEIPSLNQFEYVDHNGKPITKQEFDALVRQSGLMPFMGIRAS